MSGRDRDREGGGKGGRKSSREGGGFADVFGDDPDTTPIDSKQRKPANAKPGRRRSPDAAAATPSDDPTLDADTFRGDVPPKQFSELRRGDIIPDTRADLHGLDLEQAQHALRKAFGVASAAGRSCVLVIHGKGQGSEIGRATLKSAVPRWLRTPPLDSWVRGFAPAKARDGGEGATYVLLRSQPPRKRSGL